MISHVARSDDDENNGDVHRGYTWVMVDLGLAVLPTHFTLRHGTGGFPHWSKTLLFQISKDGVHFNPCEILPVNETNTSIATWVIKNNLSDTATGCRYIRIHQKSGRHPISMAGCELYGQVLAAIDIRSSKFLGWRQRKKNAVSFNHHSQRCFPFSRNRNASFSIGSWRDSKSFVNCSSSTSIPSFSLDVLCKHTCE